jgi:predicted transcriptional regulator of viral defense system
VPYERSEKGMDFIMEEKIRKLLERNNGIITTKQIEGIGIPRVHIKQFLESGIIEKVQKGIYISSDMIEDEFYIFQMKNSNAIFSYNTAMYFLGETERTPDRIDVTVYSGYNKQRFPDNIRVHYIKKELLNMGVITVKTPHGFNVKSYNIERTICDIIKGRNTGIDKEQSNKFIRSLIKSNKVDINKIYEYAEKLKCTKQLETVMEWII